VSTATVDTARQPAAKTLGQLWGIAFWAFIFGSGAFRLILKFFKICENNPPSTVGDYALYAIILLLGVGKAEFLFRRKLVQRTLARARDALGETGWSGDYWLAPFCMFSFYRPWSKKHMILSWVIVPIMVGLALLFAFGDMNPIFQGAVDLAIGLALAYAALVYVIFFVRVLAWWVTDAKKETIPLPEKASVM
jgi:hypothetical protein